jgi:hypothetical protein
LRLGGIGARAFIVVTESNDYAGRLPGGPCFF